MIQIYYEDGASQVIRPTNQFQPTSDNVKALVQSVAGVYPVKYFVSDFKK